MDQQQARRCFEQAVNLLFEVEEQVWAARHGVSPELYQRWITAKMRVWITFERWQQLRGEAGEPVTSTGNFPIQLKYGLGIRPRRAAAS